MHTDLFERYESAVRYYCRKMPNLLKSGQGALVRDAEGREFIDFLSACGTLNYGHNHPRLKAAAIDYLAGDGIVAGLDFHTDAKMSFIETFREIVLEPRRLDYRMQFTGPTGANCVEAALKLARAATGRQTVVAFTNAFHGVSLGALSVTASGFSRRSVVHALTGVVRLPFDGYGGAGIESLERFEEMAMDPSGGVDPVAAFIVEAVQGEGGLNVASGDWMRTLARTASRLGALLIVDDIQAGCGRTGTFFSFERAGIQPDMVCLAKSISGLGLPMSLLLMKPRHDVWLPGEHNGTFRGNGLAFVTAAAALELWRDSAMSLAGTNSAILSGWTGAMAEQFSGVVRRRKGIGMMQGLEFTGPEIADRVQRKAVERGVILECCGPKDEVLKLMAPLNIERALFEEGLRRVSLAICDALADRSPRPTSEWKETLLDRDDDRRDPIAGSELAHGVS